MRQEAGDSGQHPGGRRLGAPTQRLPPALTSRKIDMPLDSCRAELSSSEELPEDGGVPRASSVLPGAPSILAALPPSPVCGCGPLAERRSRLRAPCPRPSSRPALQAPRLAPAPASLGLRVPASPSPAPSPPPARSDSGPPRSGSFPALSSVLCPSPGADRTRVAGHDREAPAPRASREEAAQTEWDRWKRVYPEQPKRRVKTPPA